MSRPLRWGGRRMATGRCLLDDDFHALPHLRQHGIEIAGQFSFGWLLADQWPVFFSACSPGFAGSCFSPGFAASSFGAESSSSFTWY